MNMKTQKVQKKNMLKPNLYKAALIQFELKKRGWKQTKIAQELGITDSAVYRCVHGVSKSQKVDNWIENNLELKFGN